jgi:DNA-binding NarL/FixJ family response regulator
MTSERVLVADDQKAVRDGLRLMLGMLGLLGIEVIGEAAGGTDAVRLIVDKQPHVRVVVLTAFSDPSVQRRQAGAMVGGEHPGVPAAPQAGSAPDGLTQREVEVLTEIAAGLSNAEIAGKFRISGATVKSHINHLLTKTAMRDRGQLVAYAFRHGLAA